MGWVRGAALRTVRGLFLAVFVILIMAMAALYAALRTGPGQELAVVVALDRLRTRMVGDVRVGGIAASPDLSGSLGLIEVQVTDVTGATVVRADSARVRYSLLGLLRGRYEISQLDIWGPEVRIKRLGDGSVNAEHILRTSASSAAGGLPHADSLGAPGRARAKLVIRNVSVHGARAYVDLDRTHRRKPLVVHNLNARLPEVWVGTPEGDQIEIESASLVLDPTSRNVVISDLEGRVVRVGQRLIADADLIALGASRGTGQVQVQWGGEDGVRTQIDAELAQLQLEDFRWVDADLPRGWASGTVHARLGPDARQVQLTDFTVQSESGSVHGSGILDLGGVPAVRDARMRLDGLDLALLQPWLGEDAHGILSGDLDVDGTRSAVNVSGEVTLVSAKDPGISSRIRLDGGVRIQPNVAADDLLIDSPRLDYRLVADYVPAVRLRGAGPLTVRANGRLSDSLYVDADLSYSLDEQPSRLQWSGLIRELADGRLWLGGTMQIGELRLAALRSYLPRAGLRGSVRGRVEVNGPLTDLSVNTDLRTSAGDLTVAARVDAFDPAAGLTVEGPLLNFRPSALTSRAPDETVLSGAMALRTIGFDPATAVASGTLELTAGSRVGRLDLGPMTFAGRLRDGLVEVDTLVAVTALGDFRGTGSLAVAEAAAPRAELALRVSTETFDGMARLLEGDDLPFEELVADTALAIEEAPIEGRAEGNLVLSGWLGSLSVDGNLEGSDMVFGDFAADAARLRVIGRDLPSGAIEADLEATNAVAWGRQFRRLEADLTGSSRRGDLDVFLVRSETDDLRARMVVERDSVETRFFVDRLTLRSDGDRWNLGGPAMVSVGDQGVTIRDFQFVRPGETSFRLRVDGQLPREGQGRLNIDAQRMNLRRLARLLQIEEDAEGVFDLTLQATGDVADPDVRFSISGGGVGFRSARVDAFRGSFTYRSGVADLVLDGHLEGTRILEARGSTPFRFSLQPFDFGLLDDGEIDADLVANRMPLALALGFSPSFEQIEGRVDGRINFGGTPSDLRPSGTLRVSDGAFSLPDLGIYPRQARGDLSLREDGSVDVNVSARDEGLATITGSMDLSNLRNPEFNLTASASRFRAVDRRDLAGRLSGQVELNGSYTQPAVTGSLITEEAVLYVEEIQAQSLTQDLNDPALLRLISEDDAVSTVVEAQNPFLRNLSAAVDIKLARDTWLRSEEMNVELDGDLQIIYDRAASTLSMLGSLDAVRGTYRVGGRQFNVQEGDIEFFGTRGVNPTLDIRAVTRLRTAGQPLDIFADVTGTLLQPNVRLSSDEAALSQEDLFSYIVFGRPSYGLTSGESAVLGSAVGTVTAFAAGAITNTFSTAVTNVLPLDYVSFSPAQNVGSEGFAGGFGLRSTQVEVGQYLTDDLFVSVLLEPFRQAENADLLTGIRAELSLGDKWSIEGFYENQFARQRVTTFDQAFASKGVLGLFLFRDWTLSGARR